MIGTANWYCAKCSRFNDNALNACDSCGRVRGSARNRDTREEPNLYWIRVAQGKSPNSAKAPGRKPGPPGSPQGRPG